MRHSCPTLCVSSMGSVQWQGGPWPLGTTERQTQSRTHLLEGVKIMDVKTRPNTRGVSLRTPTDLSADATRDISGALNALLADMFALYLKTKNFHWHVSGPHFRDYHLLLDEQADEVFATTDPIAERVRKIGGTTLRSIGQIAARTRLLENDAAYVTPLDMLAE